MKKIWNDVWCEWDEKCLKNDVRFSPHPNFYLSTTFFVSLLIYFLKSNQHQLNYINCYLLSPITSTTYIDANPIKKTKTRMKFFENQKNNNCRLKLSLFYPNILSIVLYVTTYYNILTNWNKKIEISFQHITFSAYYCWQLSAQVGFWIYFSKDRFC